LIFTGKHETSNPVERQQLGIVQLLEMMLITKENAAEILENGSL